tara:strand:+ start:570 stop:734 length:165 start_codon:yes stop_codon:yes gene_type:complete
MSLENSRITNLYIVNEDGEVVDQFTLQACEEVLYNNGYTIEEKYYCDKTKTWKD